MLRFFCLFTLGCVLLSSCKKQDDFTSASVNDYYPLQVGKYITYNLDSTVFINFNKKDTIIKYQAQDRVDSQIVDNLGRTAFMIHRFIRKDAAQPWTPNNTFMAVPTENSIEFVENNLRYIKLKIPITEGFSWHGNSYIDSYSLNSDLKYLADWDYTYDSLNAVLNSGSLTVDSTVTVDQRDEFLGQDPKIPGTQYAEKNYSVEKYGKGIGLVFKEFIHWEYQGVDASYTGYGVKLTMIDHN
jgi:hypothetical protein